MLKKLVNQLVIVGLLLLSMAALAQPPNLVLLGQLDEDSQIINRLTEGNPALNTGVLSLQQLHKLFQQTNTVLLIHAKTLTNDHFKQLTPIALAKQYGRPIILENSTKEQMKTLTGLGLHSRLLVIKPEHHGRYYKLYSMDYGTPEYIKVHSGLAKSTVVHTVKSVQNSLKKMQQNLTESVEGCLSQFAVTGYAIQCWDVYLHGGDNANNNICVPYSKLPGQCQIGNAEVGVRIRLSAAGTSVAGKQVTRKYLHLFSLGAGVTSYTGVPWQYNHLLAGAFQTLLSSKYTVKGPNSMELVGVAPPDTLASHQVTIDTGWALMIGLNARTGVTASYSFGASTLKTKLITERTITASHRFYQDSSTKQQTATQSSTHKMSATKDAQKMWSTTNWGGLISGGEHIYSGTVTDIKGIKHTVINAVNAFDDPHASKAEVRNWPLWSTQYTNQVQYEGIYNVPSDYEDTLLLTASHHIQFGFIYIGTPLYPGYVTNTRYNFITRRCAEISPEPPVCDDSYNFITTFEQSKMDFDQSVTIDTNTVNYSAMPTCADKGFTQPSIGVWRLANCSEQDLSIVNVAGWRPDNRGGAYEWETDSPNAFDYGGSLNYQVGYTTKNDLEQQKTLFSGQFIYVGLCSTDRSQSKSMYLTYQGTEDKKTATISWDASGNYVPEGDGNAYVDPTNRIIAIGGPAKVSSKGTISCD